ncbi:unnamed protein product [Chironomus riparius]|uniref:Uncharacterized protein n=1 Tax=Chironomus riparius TaxID=315576 RepID=A0A9N9RUG1_9DIPT|nr:unnamed protein product [Chironomus riparius]
MINEFLPCAELKHNNIVGKMYEKRLGDIFAGFYRASVGIDTEEAKQQKRRKTRAVKCN